MLPRFFWVVFLMTFTTFSIAQEIEVKEVWQRYQTLRPNAEQLAMYQLNWANSLDKALKKAANQNRPIFLIIIHARYGNIQSGHC